ncbi:YbjN domain-containing protein [Alcanivorax quisquiliarum]|uniref:YbjN domain-containing protein n=1 Tax=Alcanivorax quisquiliarum TaxID=2933565 RepID=A0ABT0E4C9_9GAMM|nr:YbjN domain-containing protein [Alcanivorax quisquiliarum]MCK0536651.1 YbjN domain-containing protein [Alcanivorax quisquiliarum]
MLSLVTPDAGHLERWLQQAGIEYYICDQCHGLHLSALQAREGVLDARLFLEDDGILLSTELEIRPSSLFLVQADLGRLNMSFPMLKIFLDVNDDTLPRMVACDLLLTQQGITAKQFAYFVQSCMDACQQLLDDCQQTDCLMGPEGLADNDAPPHGALH